MSACNADCAHVTDCDVSAENADIARSPVVPASIGHVIAVNEIVRVIGHVTGFVCFYAMTRDALLRYWYLRIWTINYPSCCCEHGVYC